MNKYLTLSLAVLAPLAAASQVVLGSGVGVQADSANASGHLGVVLNAEHHRPLTANKGYFVATNLYVTPELMNAPASANLVVGGVFNNVQAPVKSQLGFSLEVENDIAGHYQLAPGVMVAASYDMTDSIAMRLSGTASVPTDAKGICKKLDVKASFGVSTYIPVEA